MLTTRFPWSFSALSLTAGLLLSITFPAFPQSPNPDTPVDAIDLRPAFKQWNLPTRLQGDRNTCSVFTVAGALEYALAHQKGQAVPLSVEYLNWASNQIEGVKEDGSYFSDLWAGFSRYGACPESELAYRPAFNPALTPGQEIQTHAGELTTADLQLHWLKRWDPNTGLTGQELASIKQILSRRWPVCGGFRWPKKPVQWQDDIMVMPAPGKVYDGHSVLLVGFRDDPAQPGGGLFIFRNTSNYGRDGYMPYAYAGAYMNDAVWIESRSGEMKPSLSPEAANLINPMTLIAKGRNCRVSSNQLPGWHSENLDMNWLKPGQTVDIPTLDGPGVITHIWITSHSGWVDELHSLSLRIYYDGSAEPGVEVPLGDFFAVGHGKPAEVNSIPVQVSPTGSLTCYWRMPFRQQARIVITNDNPDRSTGIYWQIDWMQLDELPAETPYFYARYRQEYPAVAGQDYLLADLKGSGWYVGTVMSVTLGQEGWFGEGDDFFYIDGEEIPSLQGTGSEDYFNDAWGFRVRNSPWFGQPRWQDYGPGDSGVCYRWHLPDPVLFSESLKVAIEHRGNLDISEDGFFLERPDFFSSVAYWYQTGKPQTTFPPLPGWQERRVPWQLHHLVKTFRFAKSTGPAKVAVQTQGFFGARPLLSWLNEEPNALLTLPFELAESGLFNLRLTAASGPALGRYDIEIDGNKLVTADFRTSEEAEADVILGTRQLEKGPHTLSFRATADTQKAGPLAVEILRLLSLPQPAQREVRTHHEAHFIRLGIGRALYAYRLAFDTLPDSLETLVEKGFMPDRYLKDENSIPLKAWREGDAMFVESAGPNHWKHSWKGLDARR